MHNNEVVTSTMLQENIDQLEGELSARKVKFREIQLKIKDLQQLSAENQEHIVYIRGQIDVLKNLKAVVDNTQDDTKKTGEK